MIALVGAKLKKAKEEASACAAGDASGCGGVARLPVKGNPKVSYEFGRFLRHRLPPRSVASKVG
jgi:hypothetical protein